MLLSKCPRVPLFFLTRRGSSHIRPMQLLQWNGISYPETLCTGSKVHESALWSDLLWRMTGSERSAMLVVCLLTSIVKAAVIKNFEQAAASKAFITSESSFLY